MTTTAFDDQFTDAPEPVRQMYSIVDILRRNVADLEIALKQQTERAEKAEEELKELREQVPLTFVHDPNGYAIGGTHTEIADALPVGTDLYARPIPTPIPAPAVPTDEHIHAVYRVALGQSIRERDMPEIRKFARALMQSAEVRHD